MKIIIIMVISAGKSLIKNIQIQTRIAERLQNCFAAVSHGIEHSLTQNDGKDIKLVVEE